MSASHNISINILVHHGEGVGVVAGRLELRKPKYYFLFSWGKCRGDIGGIALYRISQCLH